jgi:hypothetical protein
MQRSIDVRRNKLYRSGGTFIALALTAACWLMSSLPAPAGQQLQAGHVPRITKRLASIGRLDGNTHLDLAIGLPLRNREKLTNLLQELYQPSSANFRHYLTADQFASSFGPSQEDYEAVIHFAQSHGLNVKGTHPNRTLVDVSGSVGDIEKAFHIKMRVYPHPTEARTFFAPDVEPSLDLDTPVLAISGLDNYVTPRPRIQLQGASSQPRVQPLGGGGSGGGGGGGGNTGPFEGYDFRNAYAAGVSQDGSGQSVGLFELFAFSAQDIQDYEDEAGISPYVNVQPVLIDGATGDDSDVDWIDYPGYLDYSFEVTVDIEMAISMAPGLSSVLVYEGPTPMDEPPLGTNYIQDTTTTDQINDVLNRMATDDLAKQLSCSYGFDINLSTVQIFQQYAAQGQSFFLASGDSGAYSGAIDEPADDPNITVVGGTTLTTSSSTGSWLGESVWLTPASYDPFSGYTPEEASGGGVSLTYGIPTYQQGISMTANQGSTTMRNTPDVALVANNVDIVWGNDFIGESSDWTAAGTSLATPLWAGFIALVNEQAAATGKPPVGFVNPALYAIGKSTSYHSCFHDITAGNNYTADSPTKYEATSGYDLCSGWGSMIGSNLMQALLAPPSENLLIKPSLGFTSFGPGRGPFSVTSQTYTLTNIGSNPLNWSLVNTSAWLNVSATGGTLKPGGPAATVTVSLNLAASNFLIGNYSGNVPIADTTDGVTQNREFDLYVGNGGFETGDFTDWTLIGDPTLDFPLAGDDVDVAGTSALYGEPDEIFVHSGLYGAYLGEYPDTGSLSQAVATTAGQQYLVSFWLTSVPYEGSTVPNAFAAIWNGSALFSQTNLDAFGWTNMQYVVPATSASTTLEFDFDNVPGAFGLDDVSVEPVPAPVFQSAAVTNHTITFTWSGVANLSYQVQSASNLPKPNWTNVGAPIIAPGNSVSASESTGSGSQQYYRVILLANP